MQSSHAPPCTCIAGPRERPQAPIRCACRCVKEGRFQNAEQLGLDYSGRHNRRDSLRWPQGIADTHQPAQDGFPHCVSDAGDRAVRNEDHKAKRTGTHVDASWILSARTLSQVMRRHIFMKRVREGAGERGALCEKSLFHFCWGLAQVGFLGPTRATSTHRYPRETGTGGRQKRRYGLSKTR